jgi:disulfide bond formation protein DsbB
LVFRRDTAAALLVGGVSNALLLGAFAFQYLGGLPPCEMCVWQRWPHGAAILLGAGGGLLVATGALPAKAARTLAWLAVIALVITGAIGVFHAGVEWKLWPGPSHCTGVGDPRSFDIVIVRCDEAAWRLLGLSLAGYNAIFSFIVAAIAISWLRTERKFA